jgi:hypothetical protein
MMDVILRSSLVCQNKNSSAMVLSSAHFLVILVFISLLLYSLISVAHYSVKDQDEGSTGRAFRQIGLLVGLSAFLGHFVGPRAHERSSSLKVQDDSIGLLRQTNRRLSSSFDPKTVKYKSSAEPKSPPIIYTFYHPVAESPNGRGTGMTQESDDQMIHLWAQQWKEIGWDPRILNLTHARMHPKYQEYYNKIENIPLLGKNKAGVNKEYNMYCYLRWLAMVVVGGGFMSDYDVIPIRQLDSTVGSFTVYSSGNDGRGIPCLMSGTEEEWSNMAFAIVQNGLSHPEADLWSDMWALMDIRETMPYFALQTVIEATRLLTGKPWTERECKFLEGKDAIHFSHNTMVNGVKREGETYKDRPRIAIRVLQLFRENCLRQEVEVAS